MHWIHAQFKVSSFQSVSQSQSVFKCRHYYTASNAHFKYWSVLRCICCYGDRFSLLPRCRCPDTADHSQILHLRSSGYRRQDRQHPVLDWRGLIRRTLLQGWRVRGGKWSTENVGGEEVWVSGPLSPNPSIIVRDSISISTSVCPSVCLLGSVISTHADIFYCCLSTYHMPLIRAWMSARVLVYQSVYL